MATELWAMALVGLASIIGAGGAVFLKKGSHHVSRRVLEVFKNRELIAGIALYGISTIIFLMGLKGGELSVLYPIVSLGYVWTCVLSIKFLGEHMNTTKWIGVGAILVGVALIGIGS